MELVTSVVSGVFGLIFFIVEFVLIVYALMDIFKNPNFNLNTKLLWVIIIVLIPILGSLLYIFWGRNQSFL
ncbi:PLDc N-terminal domain-containing protein [Mucilaginibacter sp. HMF5004]|uniref:PLDc N-terminal domain-containing protein n=1 Tax=Mucilaginibacter rivuli TaxID=2857527 RepID=UPI001C5D327D|nr:PLDc N-terminal domain-containing protein [Mucilaginibacter rivuli]MBW4890306.1 PLDc N-terminal domain-containing protein [Mucilaginibacter rivuli]